MSLEFRRFGKVCAKPSKANSDFVGLGQDTSLLTRCLACFFTGWEPQLAGVPARSPNLPDLPAKPEPFAIFCIHTHHVSDVGG